MNVAVSKWGNSLGIRVPAIIAETLGLKAGDQVDFEVKDDGMFMKKKQAQSTSQMFEEFYGKPFEEITDADLGAAEEIDWGDDIGGETF
ncbi:MAG: AbrB/MazE/SpoVT family DNA-binding domain-containing protein [Lachnospiraceae bacterium]|nr:AbrB/MazE/SpoVT family DNA-binding domain-containing protein [Lachnospiraceae bacterium]